MDRKELTGAALDTIELVPAEFESVPADKLIAFAPGTREFGRCALWRRAVPRAAPGASA
jgi:hypothetical protein